MDIKSGFLDRAIGVFSPRIELSRLRVRAQKELMLENIRRFDAGSFGRRTADWYAPPTSVNKETEVSLNILRFRSRELVRNNPFARRAIQAISVNTVGLGIRPSIQKPKLFTMTDKQLARLKDFWTDWAESTDCDYDGKLNFYGLQKLAVRCMEESGEVLIRKRWTVDKTKVLPMQIQVLEPDFLDTTKNTPVGLNNGEGYDIQGVRFDKNGVLVGYHMFKVHPGEGAYSVSELIPASEIIHMFDKERPGQVRGIPVLTTSAMTLRDFDAYEQAQLIRQKIAACFAVFVQDNDRDITPSGIGDDKKPRREKVEPGIIEYMPAGKTMTFANPPTVQNYDEYATSILRKAAAGIGISYEMLTADLSNVNFSSGRMGWIEAHRMIQDIQMLIMVPQFCDPIWKWFLQASVIAGNIKEGALKTKCKWTPPRREMIDPVKESKALIDLIRAGLESWQNGARQLGQDPEVLMDEVVADFKKMEENELMLICDPRYDATRTNGALPVEEGAEGDEPEEQTGKQKKMLKKAGKANQ